MQSVGSRNRCPPRPHALSILKRAMTRRQLIYHRQTFSPFHQNLHVPRRSSGTGIAWHGHQAREDTAKMAVPRECGIVRESLTRPGHGTAGPIPPVTARFTRRRIPSLLPFRSLRSGIQRQATRPDRSVYTAGSKTGSTCSASVARPRLFRAPSLCCRPDSGVPLAGAYSCSTYSTPLAGPARHRRPLKAKKPVKYLDPTGLMHRFYR